MFSEYGIPEILIIDNCSQFRCHNFITFSAELGIEHTKSSTYYPQSNGHFERMVNAVKNMLRKHETTGEDSYTALPTEQYMLT